MEWHPSNLPVCLAENETVNPFSPLSSEVKFSTRNFPWSSITKCFWSADIWAPINSAQWFLFYSKLCKEHISRTDKKRTMGEEIIPIRNIWWHSSAFFQNIPEFTSRRKLQTKQKTKQLTKKWRKEERKKEKNWNISLRLSALVVRVALKGDPIIWVKVILSVKWL